MRPPHLDGVSSDRGRLDLSEPPESAVETSEALPEVHLHYRLDVDGFIDSLESALSNKVAGYAMGLNKQSQTLRRLDWGWAHEASGHRQSLRPDASESTWPA